MYVLKPHNRGISQNLIQHISINTTLELSLHGKGPTKMYIRTHAHVRIMCIRMAH